MAWFEHGGSRIYYEEAGSGDSVLLLPGFTDTIAGHGAVRERLAGRYRVIAADLPGSGRSGPQPRMYRPGYYLEDAAAMAALLDSLRAGPVHLLGFSDGGETALNLAAMAPRRVRSLLAWGASGVINDPGEVMRSLFRGVLDNPAAGLEGYRDYLLAAYGEATARASIQSFLAAAEEVIAAGGDVGFAAAERVTCPVLLLKGEADVFVQEADVAALARRVAKGRMILVPDAGHGVHEDQPEWFLSTVEGWLGAT